MPALRMLPAAGSLDRVFRTCPKGVCGRGARTGQRPWPSACHVCGGPCMSVATGVPGRWPRSAGSAKEILGHQMEPPGEFGEPGPVDVAEADPEYLAVVGQEGGARYDLGNTHIHWGHVMPSSETPRRPLRVDARAGSSAPFPPA